MPKPTPLDPNRIDVSLDLIGADSVQRVDQLIAGLAGLQQALAGAASSFNPEEGAAGQQRLAGRMGPGGVYEGGQSPNASNSGRPAGGNAHAKDAHGQNSSQAGNAEEDALRKLGEMANPRDRLRDFRSLPPEQQGTGFRERAGNFLDRQIEGQNARERAQAYDRGYSDPGQTGNRSTGGGATGGGSYGAPRSGVSGGGSLPPGAGFDDPGLTAIQKGLRSDPLAYQRSQESPGLPQIGEFTITDNLQILRDIATRRASRAQERARDDYTARARKSALDMGYSEEEFSKMHDDFADSDEAAGAGRMAYRTQGFLGLAGSGVGKSIAAHRSLTAVHRELMRPERYVGGLQQAGVQAGYERADSTAFGIQSPLDAFRSGSAVREGVNQRINQQRLRLKGGIDGEQASAIIQATTSRGYTGEYGQRMQFDGLAPLVQEGQNADIAASMMDKGVRNGISSIEDMRTTLTRLGPAARAARMSLDEYQQSLDSFAETAEEHGATYQQGVSTGKAMSTGFGITPQQAASTYNSPMIQGAAQARFGALPTEVGAMGAGAQAQATMDAIRMADNVTAGMEFRDLKDSDGNVILSGSERHDIMAAQQAGLDLATYKNLKQKGDAGVRAVSAGDALQKFKDASSRVGERKKGRKDSFMGIDVLARDEDGGSTRREAGVLQKQWDTGVAPALEQLGSSLTGDDKKDFDRRLKQINETRAKGLAGIGDSKNRDGTKAAQELIEKYRPKTEEDSKNKQLIGLTDEARKLFTLSEDKRKADAQAGGKSTASKVVGALNPFG